MNWVLFVGIVLDSRRWKIVNQELYIEPIAIDFPIGSRQSLNTADFVSKSNPGEAGKVYHQWWYDRLAVCGVTLGRSPSLYRPWLGVDNHQQSIAILRILIKTLLHFNWTNSPIFFHLSFFYSNILFHFPPIRMRICDTPAPSISPSNEFLLILQLSRSRLVGHYYVLLLHSGP